MADPAGSSPGFSRRFAERTIAGGEGREKPVKREVESSIRGTLQRKGGVAESVESSVVWMEEDPTLSSLLDYSSQKSDFYGEAARSSRDPLQRERFSALSAHSGEYKMRPIVARLLFGDLVIGELRNVAEKGLLSGDRLRVGREGRLTPTLTKLRPSLQ